MENPAAALELDEYEAPADGLALRCWSALGLVIWVGTVSVLIQSSRISLLESNINQTQKPNFNLELPSIAAYHA